MRKLSFLLSSFITLFSLSFLALAALPNFSKDLDYAKSIQANVAKSGTAFKPKQTFKNYTDKPKQEKYYQSVTQASDLGLKNDAAEDATQDTAGKAINKSFNTRPVFKIDQNSTAMQKGNLIKNDSYNIARGISDKYVDCHKAKHCTTTYVRKDCNEETRYLTKNCTKVPQVVITKEPYQETQEFSGMIPAQDNYSGTIAAPVAGDLVEFNVTLHSGDVWQCDSLYQGYLQGVFLSQKGVSCGDKLGDLSFANGGLNIPVTGNQPLKFSIQGISRGPWSTATYHLAIKVTKYKKVPKITWQESCAGANNSSDFCTDIKTVCLEKGSTKYFEGVPVTLPCWKYAITKKCGAQSDNNCQALRDKSCIQLSAKCRTKEKGTCLVQDETYNCPIKKCSAASGIICGGNFYCMNGDCSSHNPIKNQDFGKAVTGMAAIGAAGTDIKNSKGIQAFAGKNSECREIGFFDFNNCCANKGWGQDIGLAHCNDQEKKLGKAKEKNLTYHIGFHCDTHYPPPLHGCMKGHEVYCVFSSRLAAIVQLQGRKDQLGISFGSADNPDCRGLTPDELGKLDFSKMDFSSLYKEIKQNTHFPNTGKTEQEVAKRVKDFYEKHKKHN